MPAANCSRGCLWILNVEEDSTDTSKSPIAHVEVIWTLELHRSAFVDNVSRGLA